MLMKSKIFLLLILTISPFARLFAFDCEVDGIYYNRLTTDELEVTYGTEKYSGNVMIPETVMYRDKVFNVTRIGYSAFSGCTGLTSVTIPQTITSLLSCAFQNCSSLTTITMPLNVTAIYNNAFEGCKALSSIVIPEGVTTISDNLFNGCEKLASVTLPKGITTIGEGAFMGCKSLTTLSLPNQITSIEKNAFKNCTSLTSLDLPEELTSIKESSFAYCNNLSNIVLPNKIASIGTTAFRDCTSLSSIVLSSALYTIGERAFLNCTSLSIVSMPTSVRQIMNNAFWGCTGLKKVIVNDMTAWCKILFESQESNPLHYAQHLYSDEETEIKELFIDNSVNSIGNYAFCKAENLLSIYIFRNTPPIINSNTFGNTCYTWTDVYVPEEYKQTYQNTDYWRNFKSISDLSPTVDGIKYNITSPTEAEVTNLGNDEKYSGKITIPESITCLGKTFNVVAINDAAFKDCSELHTVSIPNCVARIGRSAFYNCNSLSSVNIPEGIEKISYNSFSGCAFLTKVTIPESVKVIEGSSFENCSSLESINIPKHVTRIDERAFYGCISISSIDLPDSLTYISGQSFQNCSKLYSITIPRTVSNIGNNAFVGCDCLSLVASLNETPPTLASFGSFSRGIPILLVPRGSKDMYQNNISPDSNRGWKEYIYSSSKVLEFDFDEGEFLVLKSSDGGKIVYNGQETKGDPIVFAVKNGNDIPINIELDDNCEFISCLIDGDSIKEFTREANNIFSYTLKADKGHVVDATFANLFIEESVVVSDNMYYKILQGNEVELFPSISYFGSSDGNRTPLYSGYSGSVVIPDSIIIPASLSHPQRVYIVTGINNLAFQDGYSGSSSTKLTSVVIGNNVTCIPDNAFYRCRLLESVVLPESLTEIGYHAFFGCESLETIVFPNSLMSIGEGAFQGCEKLGSLTIPASVIKIAGRAFFGCHGLNIIIVESGNPVYDSRQNCNALIETKTNKLLLGCNSSFVPMGVVTINSDAFYRCSGLTSMVIPNSVSSIGNQAFRYCSGLTALTLPQNLTTIDRLAFSGCSNLTEIIIPRSVTSIGEWAFNECSSLTSINVSDGNSVYDSRNNCNAIIETTTNTLLFGCQNTIIPEDVIAIEQYAFCGCAGLTTIIIPENVSVIGEYAFYGCNSLTNIIIPNVITTINGNTFYGCSALSSILIGNNVNRIDDGAFYGCDNIKSFTSLSPTPPNVWLGDAFYYPTFSSYSATLYVPSGSKEAYQNAEGWKNFVVIEEINQEDEDAVTEVKAMPVLIQSDNGTLNISCAPEGSEINVYDTSGKLLTSAIANNGTTKLNITLKEKAAIVKIGEKVVKVLVK